MSTEAPTSRWTPRASRSPTRRARRFEAARREGRALTETERAIAGGEALTPQEALASIEALDESTPGSRQPMVINLGPQHPSTHGVLRLITELDGEVIRDLHPVIGYLHTGIEKQCENKTYWQAITLVTRMDYLASYFNILAYTTAVEKLLDLKVPDRAQYLRVIMCELNRITSHLVWLGTSGLELGAITMLFYTYREREKALDLGEMIAGERMNTRYFQVGGCADDMPPGFEQRLRAFIDEMPGRIDEYEEMLTQNPIWIDRTKGVGVLPAEQLLDLGVTGPALRAAGVDLDLRKAAPYCGYEHFDFQVPLGTTGDAYDRYTVRMREMRESVRIIGQALDGMPEGSHIADDRKVVLPPRGELADLHGGADPPLQARHRGLPRARGRGLLGGREPARRDRLLRRRRRLAQAAPRPHARPQLRQPAGAAAHGQGLLPGRPDHDDRLAGQRDGGCGPLVNVEEITAHIEPIRHEYAEARSLILPALKFAQTEKGHLTPRGPGGRGAGHRLHGRPTSRASRPSTTASTCGPPASASCRSA